MKNYPIMLTILLGIMTVTFSTKVLEKTSEPSGKTTSKKFSPNYYVTILDCTTFPYNEADFYSIDIGGVGNFADHASCGSGTSTMIPGTSFTSGAHNVTVNMGLSSAFNYGVFKEHNGSPFVYFYFNPSKNGVYDLGSIYLDGSGTDYEVEIHAN